MNIKTISFILLAIAILAGCNSGQSDEEIRAEINEKKKTINELEKEIQALENKQKEDSIYNVPVNTKTITAEEFRHQIEVNGNVEAEKQATISPEINGQIRKIHIEEGERVRKGDLLVELSTEVTRKNIQELETSLELAQTRYEKQKSLWEENIGSEMQYLQAKNQKESLENRLETAKAQLEKANIKAPYSGIVDEILMKEGDLAMPGTRLLRIVNLKKLNINADISENYLSKVEKGDTVSLSFPAYPDITMDAPIYRTGNIIQPDNRTFKIQLKINNIKEKLKPNIISVLRINDYTNPQAFVVPSIIIKKDIDGDFLFVAEKNEKGNLIAKKRYVETGKSYKDQTEILNGLERGENVIVDGYNMVTSGTGVRIKNRK
ncbi:MAG: efflux RND transporter periplasmic adaptor subunit [Bacteroidales bacterium]|nr:efflux RND transporter periplasmic adaptor subunit [Bacteroidales bacterium]MCF8326921.1 efflux RND transporter periplasmic adaptor subunit [Bacteroidales bacterium]